MKSGTHKLRVAIACERCGLVLYSEVWERYQTKGGRWESGIHISHETIEPHDCKG